ncbi:MAG: undecaprenyl-diphosphatase UppP [Candidatus Paceibacterota bacterium]|jgi:undecaprenyl-diphosphatase
MNIFDSIILGIVQGLTEFLPISSSGHLIIFRDILGWHTSSDLSFDAILQLATALAIIVYFWKDIFKLIRSFLNLITKKKTDEEDKTIILAIIIGTVPAIIAGIFLEKYMETIFRSSLLVAFVLIVGSLVMYLAEKFSTQNEDLTIKKGFYIGLFQCLALVPGFSRSGATISGGLFSGLDRGNAARFSFLLSIPIILGAGLKKVYEIWLSGQLSSDWITLLVGALTAFIVGLFAIKFLMNFLKKYSLKVFIYYRLILAILIIILIL